MSHNSGALLAFIPTDMPPSATHDTIDQLLYALLNRKDTFNKLSYQDLWHLRQTAIEKMIKYCCQNRISNLLIYLKLPFGRLSSLLKLFKNFNLNIISEFLSQINFVKEIIRPNVFLC